VMERCGSCRRHQDQSRCPVAIGEKCRPRGVLANSKAARIVEQRTPKTPVIEQEAAWLDQVNLNAEARRQPQQGTGILWNVRFEQGQTQTTSTTGFASASECSILLLRYIGFVADLCGSLSHFSNFSTV